MFCKKCGFENDDSAKFCKNCGEALNIHSSFKQYNSSKQTDKENSSKNILIICLTLIIISLLIAGALLYASNNNSEPNNVPTTNAMNNSPNPQNVDNSENTQSEVTQTDNPLKIISGSFTTDTLPAKTYITVYVGEEHAGENVKIRVFYSNGGTRLNAGNIVPKTVDGSGHFTMRTANELNSYPDYADITLYDGNGNVVDTQGVNMQPVSGTQTF